MMTSSILDFEDEDEIQTSDVAIVEQFENTINDDDDVNMEDSGEFVGEMEI
ncbi:ANM_collapsed_G0054070.mRNA.1.CDS.1 [Saccharomyces cerevisiae]|nr:ANM_collapsed_G0054070.mRNA.1.CDS.1 [Saccharomyces cerevisiae]